MVYVYIAVSIMRTFIWLAKWLPYVVEEKDQNSLKTHRLLHVAKKSHTTSSPNASVALVAAVI